MSAETDTRLARTVEEVFYPDSDGQPMADSGINAHRMKRSHTALRRALLRRGVLAYVENDIFVYPVKGDPGIFNAPDLFAAPECDPFPPRRVFCCWEEPGPVAFAGEFLAIGKEHLDSPKIQEKVKFYRDRLVTTELFLYETVGKQWNSGFRFRFLRLDPAAGAYREVPAGAGGWYEARSLGLELRPVDWGIEFRDPASGELFSPVDDLAVHQRVAVARQRAATARQRAAAERQRAEAERQRAEAERQRAEAERQRAEAAEERAEAALRRSREMEQRLRELEGRAD